MSISCKAISHNKTNTYESIIHLENQNTINTPEFTHGGLPYPIFLPTISDKTILEVYVSHSLLILFLSIQCFYFYSLCLLSQFVFTLDFHLFDYDVFSFK